MDGKVCGTCGKWKPYTEYYKHKKSKDGFSWSCKNCKIKHSHQYYQDNSSTISKKTKTYRQENKDIIRQRKKDYADRNKEKISIDGMRRYNENKEAYAKRAKEYREKNKDKIKAKRKEYYEKNKNRLLKTQYQYKQDRKKTNLEFYITERIRHRFYIAIKAQNATKNYKTMGLIGCSPAEVIKHLESQFQVGMTWSNHGTHGWHIDHIRPCASFDLTDTEQQKQCFHYTNLQPLWAKDNHSKGAKYE